MAEQPIIQVSRLLDERGLSSFHIRLLVWSFFLVLIDGYDIGAIAFAAPHLVGAWHISPHALGPVFSSSLVGILIGSGAFGWVGDRAGRKVALALANLLFGFFTLIAAYSTTLDQMVWLRLLAGIGIGGVIPNVVAINVESAPRHLRATLAIIAAGCVPIGGAIPGFISAIFVAKYGWPILFVVGGIFPILFGLAAFGGLPESIKYMALHENQRKHMERMIAEVSPGLTIPPNARFVIEDERQYSGFSPTYLFRDGLALITPLLWLLFALNLMGFFFLLSWTPTVLQMAHLPAETGALAGAAIQVGGTVGALGLCRWMERKQFYAIAIMFALSVPVVGFIGYAGMMSQTVLLITTFFAGFLVLGVQTGINVVGAMVYPTSLRANGSGWELGIGRIGSIVGPLLGALFVGLAPQTLYMWSAIPFALGAVVCYAIHRLNTTRLAAEQTALAEQPLPAE